MDANAPARSLWDTIPGDDKLSAEFWKPADAGEMLVGRLEAVKSNRLGDHAIFSPVVVVKADGKDGKAFGSYAVGLNSWLSNRLGKNDTGRTIAIRYAGKQETPAGKMRTYDVKVVEPDVLDALVKRFEGEDTKLPF